MAELWQANEVEGSISENLQRAAAWGCRRRHGRIMITDPVAGASCHLA